MKFTTQVGTFIFDRTETLSLAKLIRDTVVAEILAPTQAVLLTNSRTCMDFIRSECGDVLSKVLFSFTPPIRF